MLNGPVSRVETKKLTLQVLVFLRGEGLHSSGNLRHFLQIVREGQTSPVIGSIAGQIHEFVTFYRVRKLPFFMFVPCNA